MPMLKPNRELEEHIRQVQIAIDCANQINHIVGRLQSDDQVTVAGAALIINNVLTYEIKRLLKEGLQHANR
jgi:hypothetical protein